MNKCLIVVLLCIILYASADVQDGLIDGGDVTSGLSAILSKPNFVSARLIPFVNEEDFRSPLYYSVSFAALTNPLWSRFKL
jgi:hypothetical protein